MLIRNCPDCNCEIKYKDKRGYNAATKKNSTCTECYLKKQEGEFKRNCPSCKKELIYTKIVTYKRAVKNNVLCINCSNKMRFVDDKVKFKTYKHTCSKCESQILYYNENKFNRAVNNKAICRECATNIANSLQGLSRLCRTCYREINYKSKNGLIIALMANGQCKYCQAKETANKPENIEKNRIAFSGENNPMYGKVSNHPN